MRRNGPVRGPPCRLCDFLPSIDAVPPTSRFLAGVGPQRPTLRDVRVRFEKFTERPKDNVILDHVPSTTVKGQQ